VSKNHITTREVANAFGTYLFFPRLLHPDLLADAIRSGFSGQGGLLCDFFGYAEAFDEDASKYLGLCTTTAPVLVTIGDSLLVKPDVAMAQAVAAKPVPAPQPDPGSNPDPVTQPTSTGGNITPVVTPPALKTRFYGAVEIPPQKVASSVQKIVDEVIQHLSAKYGTKVKITLDIEAENTNGFDDSTVRTVSENANTLEFKSKGFE
jgi:hypothetical protein